MTINVDQYLSFSKHLVSYAAGGATIMGVVAVGGVNVDTLVASFDHIFAGLKEISIGLGPIIAAGMGLWAAHKQSAASKLAAVAAMPEVRQIAVLPTAPADSPARVAAADPTQPKVTMAPAVPPAPAGRAA
jgi:hypothetical protein